MKSLSERLKEQFPSIREDIKKLVKEHAAKEVGKVTVEQLYGGMRGIRSLVCDTSLVEPDTGLIIRGRPIKELADKLPEEIFYLLCTGELPDKESLASLQEDLKKRYDVPSYVWNVLDAMPKDSHPMTMFSLGILCMQKESVFTKRYNEGMKKEDYWIPTLEDALTIIARAPVIAAYIYRKKYNKGERINPNPNLDWAANYAYMLGIPDPKGEFAKLMRLYLTLHSDHESGNVSAMTGATVNSALSDLYYSLSAALNGLAGPLHGLANQECLKWILEVKNKFNGVPTDDELRKYAWDTLNAGKVIPGYGHAVLRITDPRFSAFMEFGKKYCKDDPIFQIVEKVFNIVPKVLMEQGKAKDPWPNVDAISGSLLYHYGLVEFEYYTVLFGISRILGISAQAIIARGMGYPIIRPKSVTTEWVKKQLNIN
jgi:citrate synthase